MTRYLPNRRPSVNVEPGLVLRVEGPEDFGELAADLVVVLRQVVQAPLAQLERVVNLYARKSVNFSRNLSN